MFDKRKQKSLTKFDMHKFIPKERDEKQLKNGQLGYNTMSLNQLISPDPNVKLQLVECSE